MSPLINSEVWVGLIEVYPESDCALLKSDTGGFTNIVACATDFESFQERAKELCRHYHLALWSLEDAEPVRIRRSNHSMDAEIEQLAIEVQDTDQIRFSTFHTFPIDEGKKAH